MMISTLGCVSGFPAFPIAALLAFFVLAVATNDLCANGQFVNHGGTDPARAGVVNGDDAIGEAARGVTEL